MTDASRLILVDGSSYLFRAFHALPPLTNSKGMNTGAAKGVIGMLKRLQADNPADQLVVIFDAKGPTFRNDIYSEYKANRPPMPEELREQIEPIHNVIRAMGLPLISISGVEADDVIGTLSVMAAAQHRHVLISTGDKDMAQLVNDYVTLVNTMTQTVLDRDGVIEKFGVPPELIIDLLALMGDSVDNIPGVAGVGEKTALALLQNLGGVSDIYTNLDRVPELPVRGAKSLGDKLLVSQDMAELSYVLATIKTDCDLELTDADLISSAPDSERLIELYRDLEFKAWLDELLSPGLFAEAAPEAVAVSKPELTTVTITQQSVLDEWISRLEDAPLFAFDTETTSLNYMQAEIVGVSFAVEPGEAAYVPLAHINPGLEGQLNREQVLEQLRPLLESDAVKKVGQHLKYDANVLANHGISLRGIAHDTMLESYVLDAVGSRHDMGSLALKYLGQRVISFEEVAGKGAKQITFDHVPIEQAAEYAAEDADVTLRLHEALMPRLEAEPKLREVYEDLELPLVPVLSKIERNGAYVSVDRLRKQSGEIATRLAELETKACELAGQPFNLASPKQLGEILFEKLDDIEDLIAEGNNIEEIVKSNIFSKKITVRNLEKISKKK